MKFRKQLNSRFSMVETRKRSVSKTVALQKVSRNPVRQPVETPKRSNQRLRRNSQVVYRRLRKTNPRKPVCRPIKTLARKNRQTAYRHLPNQQHSPKQFKRNGFIYVILPMLETIKSLVIEMERTARLNEETFVVQPTRN